MNLYASETITRSETSTHTEARARYVSDKVSADVFGLYTRGFITKSSAIEWIEIVDICLKKNGLEKLQIKIKTLDNEEYAVSYDVVDGGQIYFDERSGGLDWYEFDKNSSASIVIRRNNKGQNDDDINKALSDHGWTTGANFLDGDCTSEKCYSKDGFGVKRNKVGW